MSIGKAEVHHFRLDELQPGQVGLRVPVLRDIVRVNLLCKPETTEKLVVDISGDQNIPERITLGLESGAPLQAKIGRTRKVFTEPVDELVLVRSNIGPWETETPDYINNTRAFTRFVNLVAYHSFVKQNNLPRKKFLFPPDHPVK